MSGTLFVLALIGATAAYVVVAQRRLRARATAEAQAAAGEQAVHHAQDDAEYLGLTSKGLAQSSGQGCLLLTDEQIFYAQWEPRRRVRIRIDQVIDAKVTTEHERPTGGVPMLLVKFEDDTGEEDRATWIVDAPDRWAQTLRGLSPG